MIHRDFRPPEALVDRARQWHHRPGDPVPARAASTVVLVRDAPDASDGQDRSDGPEVFLMHRQLTMAFAAGMAVFPGGGVDARDGDHLGPDRRLPWAGPEPATWAALLGVEAVTAVQLLCAAVRETFEECGVLLATAPGAEVFPTVEDEGWEDERRRLLDREIALSDLLVDRGLVLRTDLLRAWARWTTPEFEPRRYDTWFFLARLGQGVGARHLDGGEASRSGWSSARAALRAHGRGEVALLPPTLVTLEEVAAAATAAELVAAPRVVRAVLPFVAEAGDELVLRSPLPDQPGAAP